MKFSVYTLTLWIVGIATGVTIVELQPSNTLSILSTIGYAFLVIIISVIYLKTER